MGISQSDLEARLGQQKQRDEILLEVTRSVCPTCRQVIDAQIFMRDNRIVMRKRCPEHGRFEALIWVGRPDVPESDALQQAGDYAPAVQLGSERRLSL